MVPYKKPMYLTVTVEFNAAHLRDSRKPAFEAHVEESGTEVCTATGSKPDIAISRAVRNASDKLFAMYMNDESR